MFIVQGWVSVFFTTMLLTKLYVRVDILLTCGKDLHDPIMPLRQNAWTHKTRLILPIIEMFKKQCRIYMLYTYFAYISTTYPPLDYF